MKKIITLLTLLILITACDDGNVKVQSINFDAVPASSCGNIIYKLNSNEALILQITENTNAFANVPTATNAPVEYQINGYNHVVYRFYNGAVTSATICGSIPPATPAVTEEWVATAGTIQITTSANKTTNTTTNGTRITGYNHYIVLKNVTFSKPVGQQVYESFVFGNYTTAPTNAMAIGFNISNYLEQCSTSNVINNHISE